MLNARPAVRPPVPVCILFIYLRPKFVGNNALSSCFVHAGL